MSGDPFRSILRFVLVSWEQSARRKTDHVATRHTALAATVKSEGEGAASQIATFHGLNDINSSIAKAVTVVE